MRPIVRESNRPLKRFPSLTYGIQAFLWWDTGHVGLHLDWARLMSFSHIKQVFPWQEIEPAPGQWNFEQSDKIIHEVQRRDLSLVVRLGITPKWAYPDDYRPVVEGSKVIDTPPENYELWGNYCQTVAERYRGQIAAYQIWNEPNLMREWGGRQPDAKAYTEFLRVCSEAIRSVDPDAILISAGLAPTGTNDGRAQPDDIYLSALYEAGFQQYIDIVGAHAPGFSPPDYGPDDAERDGNGRWATFRRVEDLREIMIRNGDSDRQIAILEMGWTTDPIHPDYSWYAVDETTQARYLKEGFEYAAQNWRPWVGLMTIIYLPDPVWTPQNEEYWWAISTPDQGHRAAFFALANMAKYCDDYVIPARAPDSPEALGIVPASICP